MTGAKNPSSIVYWNDLEGDAELKTCSLAAKGLWTCHLLAIAARSPLQGVIIIGSWPCKVEADLPMVLANMVGGSPDVMAALLAELVNSGAASVDEHGRMYNRRMVRERQISEARSAAGKAGAARRWENVGDGKTMANTMANGVAKSDAVEQPQLFEKQGEIGAQQHNGRCEGDGKPMPSSLLHGFKEDTTTESVTSGARADDGVAPHKRDPRGTRLPDEWRPEDELRQWTLDHIAKHRSGVSAGHELERFRDHWSAQPGAKGRKSDWPATWRNWIRKAVEMEGKGNGSLYRQSSGKPKRSAAVAAAAAFASGLGGNGGRGPAGGGG
jgi:hypothetical protein